MGQIQNTDKNNITPPPDTSEKIDTFSDIDDDEINQYILPESDVVVKTAIWERENGFSGLPAMRSLSSDRYSTVRGTRIALLTQLQSDGLPG